MSAFQCYAHFDDVSTMYQFPTVICYDANHTKFVVVSMFMILTVVIPFAGLFLQSIFALYRCRSDAGVSIQMLVRFKLFFQRWRCDRWYWGFVFVLRQILLACTLIIAEDAFGQIFFVVSVLSIYNVFLAFWVPWRLFEINVVEFLLTVLLVLLLLAALAFTDSTEKTEEYAQVFSSMFVLLLCVGAIYILRVCFGIVAGDRQNFVGMPRPLPKNELVANYTILFQYSYDEGTLYQLIDNVPDHDLFILRNTLDIFQAASGCALEFPNPMGLRINIPNAQLTDKTTNELKQFFASKQTTESYI